MIQIEAWGLDSPSNGWGRVKAKDGRTARAGGIL
jgi:hypothetical protein